MSNTKDHGNNINIIALRLIALYLMLQSIVAIISLWSEFVEHSTITIGSWDWFILSNLLPLFFPGIAALLLWRKQRIGWVLATSSVIWITGGMIFHAALHLLYYNPNTGFIQPSIHVTILSYPPTQSVIGITIKVVMLFFLFRKIVRRLYKVNLWSLLLAMGIGIGYSVVIALMTLL